MKSWKIFKPLNTLISLYSFFFPMSKKHSPLVKWFIYLLVAMMVFSAVGVMVIYLNVPTTQLPTPDVNVIVSGGNVNTIAIPSVDTDTWVVLTWSDSNTWSDTIATGENEIITWTTE